MIKSIKSKILLLSISSVVISMVIISVIFITNLVNHNNEVIKDYTSEMINDKQQLIKNQIVAVDKMIHAILKQHKDIKQAQEQIIYLLSHIRYLDNNSGYFFAFSKVGKEYYRVFHGVKTYLNNKKIDIMKPDIKGYKFKKDLMDTATEDKFIFYHYGKPDKNGKMGKIKKKMAFAQYIPALNWTLITGIYIDDIYLQVDAMKLKNKEKLESIITQTIVIFFILLILISIIVVLIVKKTIMNPLTKFQNGINIFFQYLGDSNIKVQPIDVNTVDEIGQMSELTNSSIKVSMKMHNEIFELNNNLEMKIESRTQDLNKAKKEIEAIHKHTRDAIEYASLIQGALIPEEDEMTPFFKDHFVIWTPKDTVGGDIWLFNELRHEDECLLFFIDCTGHGVPGAFVTMIVKAVEREIVSKIIKYPDMDISPAIIMGYFNKTMKKLLKQENKDSLSNAGWDGGIVYYNKRTQILKFAGAETPLFYMTKDGEFKTVKGNRYSVGYKKCAMDYEYKETIIEVEEGMKFYCTTDGYLDQNGGEKDFPFGKKRFGNIIKKHHKEPMTQLQTIFQEEMSEYEGMIPNNDRNDDMTIISFEIGEQSDFIEDKIIEIVKYEGVMTQNVIASAMDNIETKITNMGMMGTVSTITIEYCQNMMNYSKGIREEDGNDIIPAGQIEVQYINDESYEIIATNIVSIEDKEKIEPKLIEIQGLDKSGIKKRYRELRKSGENTHGKGGGIGMYEIAKVSTSIEYGFNKINDDKYYFTMKSFVKSKVKEKEE